MAGKIKIRICFASLICVLALLLTSCDFRLKSEREVEEYLERQYGQEFTVLSSESVTDDYYDDVWRVRAYTVSPKDNPETQFFVFNTVEGEGFGVPGFRNGLQDTYSLDIFGRAFETRAAETDVEYSFNYFYPVKSSSVYYSRLYVDIEPVSLGNLEMVCTVLSQAYADTFGIVKDIPYGVTVNLTYKEPAWSEDQSCLIKIDSLYFGRFDTNTETIEKYILDEAGNLGLVWTEYDMEKKGHHSRMRYIEDTALGGGITQEFPSYTSKTTRGLLYVKLLQYISQ